MILRTFFKLWVGVTVCSITTSSFAVSRLVTTYDGPRLPASSNSYNMRLRWDDFYIIPRMEAPNNRRLCSILSNSTGWNGVQPYNSPATLQNNLNILSTVQPSSSSSSSNFFYMPFPGTEYIPSFVKEIISVAFLIGATSVSPRAGAAADANILRLIRTVPAAGRAVLGAEIGNIQRAMARDASVNAEFFAAGAVEQGANVRPQLVPNIDNFIEQSASIIAEVAAEQAQVDGFIPGQAELQELSEMIFDQAVAEAQAAAQAEADAQIELAEQLAQDLLDDLSDSEFESSDDEYELPPIVRAAYVTPPLTSREPMTLLKNSARQQKFTHAVGGWEGLRDIIRTPLDKTNPNLSSSSVNGVIDAFQWEINYCSNEFLTRNDGYWSNYTYYPNRQYPSASEIEKFLNWTVKSGMYSNAIGSNVKTLCTLIGASFGIIPYNTWGKVQSVDTFFEPQKEGRLTNMIAFGNIAGLQAIGTGSMSDAPGPQGGNKNDYMPFVVGIQNYWSNNNCNLVYSSQYMRLSGYSSNPEITCSRLASEYRIIPLVTWGLADPSPDTTTAKFVRGYWDSSNCNSIAKKGYLSSPEVACSLLASDYKIIPFVTWGLANPSPDTTTAKFVREYWDSSNCNSLVKPR